MEGQVVERLGRLQEPSLRKVINATGVILHTNLGRAPLSENVLEAIRRTAGGYTNLEYDLSSGRRANVISMRAGCSSGFLAHRPLL